MEKKKNVFGDIKSMLTRDQMKQIKGGSGGVCYYNTYGSNYSNQSESYVIFTESGCPGASASMGQYCSDLIATSGNGVYHCSYSCGC